jgi:hypothetical protein
MPGLPVTGAWRPDTRPDNQVQIGPGYFPGGKASGRVVIDNRSEPRIAYLLGPEGIPAKPAENRRKNKNAENNFFSHRFLLSGVIIDKLSLPFKNAPEGGGGFFYHEKHEMHEKPSPPPWTPPRRINCRGKDH